MVAFVLAIMLRTVSPPTCETYAPRLDGTEVTVCSGRVVRVAMAPRVFVDYIDSCDGTATVMSESGAVWTIRSTELPGDTTEGDTVYLGRGGARRVADDGAAAAMEARRARLGAGDDHGTVRL